MRRDVSSPIDEVRRSTSDAHDRVEQVISERFFEHRDFDRNDFRELLETYWGLYGPLDAVLEPLADRFLRDFQYRPRSPRIADDLRALGVTDREIEHLPTLERNSFVDPEGPPPLLGALYVVQGASLGNQVIRRQLEPRFDGIFRRADAFFHDDGASTGERWQRFRDLFNRRIDSDAELESAVDATRKTFAAYEEWFS